MSKILRTNRATAEISIKIHAANHSVRSWAVSHGFSVQTVRNLLAGNYGNRQNGVCGKIRAALIADGFVE